MFMAITRQVLVFKKEQQVNRVSTNDKEGIKLQKGTKPSKQSGKKCC